MRELPKSGLIVSCYLESMSGCEESFIRSVINLPEVVAVRVEGYANIEYSRKETPDKYIIGLVKVGDPYKITPTLDEAHRVIISGADMVATENYLDILWERPPFPIMADCRLDQFIHEHTQGKFTPYMEDMISGKLVFSTTFERKGFQFAQYIRDMYYGSRINIEGGITTKEEIYYGLQIADYVTVGKIVNDPPTIVKALTCLLETQ